MLPREVTVITVQNGQGPERTTWKIVENTRSVGPIVIAEIMLETTLIVGTTQTVENTQIVDQVVNTLLRSLGRDILALLHNPPTKETGPDHQIDHNCN